MSKYDLNVKRLVMLLLPPRNRKPVLATLLFTITEPVARLYREFTELRGECEYRSSHNGQKILLRALLNDYFDRIERRITITDAVVENATVLYMRTLESPLAVPPRSEKKSVTAWLRGAVGEGAYDFWITIPAALKGNTDERRLRAIVNIYKLAAMRYGINYSNNEAN